jgi:shikimate dehydrogenase
MIVLKKVGLIGWPVSHSISPAMHNAAFAVMGLREWRYELMPVPPDIVRASLKSLRDEGGFLGVNVTVPLKELVLPYVQADAIAKAVGAANTIDLRNLTATNTDVGGFMDDLRANAVKLDGARVVVLGAGGAARAAVYGLVQAGAEVLIVNRSHEKAQRLANDLKISGDVIVSHAEAAESNPTLIVNATSVGMIPSVNQSPWPANVPMPREVIGYDMVYRPERTLFMQQVEARGGQAANGLGMLVRQGAAAFTLWTGVDAPIEVMYEAARAALRES